MRTTLLDRQRCLSPFGAQSAEMHAHVHMHMHNMHNMHMT